MAPRRSPSFFKILLDPSAPHLPLPPDFVSRHLENKIPKDPVIRSANGGYSWRLKMKKIGESCCFSDGWDSVVRDNELGFGDFLVFRFFNKSVFKMAVYSPNGCEKDFTLKTQVDNDSGIVDDDVVVEDGDYEEDEAEDDDDDDEDEDDEDDYYDDEEEDYEEKEDGDDEDDGDGDGDDDDDGDGGGDIDGHDGDPFFMLIISKGHKNMMRLPADFADLAGIEGEGTLMAANLDGKEWQLGVRVEKCNRSERYYLSAGWADFRRSNDLSDGDECVFKFIRSEDKLLLARVTKNKRSPATEVVKRKRKLPQGSSGKVQASKVETRAARGQGGVDVKSVKGSVNVVKRSSGGKPSTRRHGKPARKK